MSMLLQSPDAILLAGDALVLRPFQSEDLADFFAFAKEPGPMEMMGYPHPRDIVEAEKCLNHLRDQGYLAIIENDIVLIGFAGITDAEFPGYERLKGCRIEVMLGSEYWGFGYATDTLRAVSEQCFALGYDLVWAQAGDFNRAAIRALDKAGFRYINEIPDDVNVDIVEAKNLQRFVLLNQAPAANDGETIAEPKPIDVPDISEDILVEEVDEETYQKNKDEVEKWAEEEEKSILRAAETLENDNLEEEKKERRLAAEAEEKKEHEELVSRDDEAEAKAVRTLLGEPEPEEPEEFAEPITIEVNEDETVIMEIDGVQEILYQGKPRPKVEAPKPAPAAPAPAPRVVYVTRPAAPTKRPPLNIRKKSGGAVKPSRDPNASAPIGTSDDGQRSIHTVSFEDKMNAAPKEIREKYEALSKYLTEVYGCSHRVSFSYDSYRVGKRVAIALSLGGVHLRMNSVMDPKVYADTKMKVNDDSGSKQYADMPSCLKILSDKTMKQAFRLIDDTMKSLGAKKKKVD